MYTIDEFGRVYGPTGQQLDYEVRQNRFGDVLTVAIGEGDQMQWHSVIELVSQCHFDGDLIVHSTGSKLGFLSLTRRNIGFPGDKKNRFVSLSEHCSGTLPKRDSCIEIWYRYSNRNESISEIHKALNDKIQMPMEAYRNVVRAALIAGIRE